MSRGAAEVVSLFAVALIAAACSSPGEQDDEELGAPGELLRIELEGSLQNPAWSPDGTELLFTRFRGGYNEEPADLYIVDLATNAVRALVSEGSGNVNLPGSVWSPSSHQIVFSSSREPHDEIFLIDEDGAPGDERRITSRRDSVAYEPSLSPDGAWIVFESHPIDGEDNGIVMKYQVDGSGGYIALTDPGDDCRQPNGSPAGGRIVYQRFAGGQWDLWVVDADGSNAHPITSGPGDKTDASFSPDGRWIVFSGDLNELDYAGIFVMPISGGPPQRVTDYVGYAGAPSWSPDRSRIAFEAYPGDPDGSSGTTIRLVDLPDD